MNSGEIDLLWANLRGLDHQLGLKVLNRHGPQFKVVLLRQTADFALP